MSVLVSLLTALSQQYMLFAFSFVLPLCCICKTIYIIKELVQPKMSLNREFLLWKERGRGMREREVGRGKRERCVRVRERGA
jgi:hypothetical protein